MIKFKTIREYINILPSCEFCGGPMHLELLTKQKKWPQGPITYTSGVVDNLLVFYYLFEDKKYFILSIDLDTNKVHGTSTDHIQKVIWDHELSIVRHCVSIECNEMHSYVCQSSAITLERKNSVILPFWNFLEGITVKFGDKKYTLVSSQSLNMTFLYHHPGEERNLYPGKNIVKNLPLISLYNIKGKDNIINKIKTILVFS